MNDSSRYIIATGVLIGAILFGWMVLFPGQTAAQETGPNLLTNGDFEQGGGGAWPFQDNIMEVQVAPGWHAFWLDNRPAYATPAAYCSANEPNCSWARPEFRDTKAYEFAYRVHGGNYAQKYFTFNQQHEAGLYQKVDGITPDSRLRFQIYLQTWSCAPDTGGAWNDCPTTPNSNDPAPMHTKVGIDPTGQTNPWAATVVWSQEVATHDVWTAFWVEATAQAESVTVFTYSRVDWTNTYPRVNNDVYLDDASLVTVGDVVPTAAPPPPTSAVPPTPRSTATPHPNGAVIHTVVSGDTLLGIAFQYGIELDVLRRLNAGSLGPNDMLSIGQEVVISGEPISPPTPTLAPTEEQPVTEPTVAPGATEVTVEPGAVGGGASLCVLAYNDRNVDMLYQAAGEELLPNVTLSVVGTGGLAGTYTTDGLGEPYCFQNLQPGNYVVQQQVPAGYVASGPEKWGVLLGAGQSYALQLGYTRGENSAAGTADSTPEGATSESLGEEEEEPATSLLMTIIRVSGILALLLVIVVGALFIVSRRRA
ncbi:MAG TPA: LysM peptidoglycan-binding domain-containing protein [Thermoflexia bacterium]|nr:LysM peptidoglycan-binding domain-containing protein [Thermoflexia bacterium]